MIVKEPYLPFQIFGSKTSLDLDIVFFVGTIKDTIEENKALINFYSNKIKSEKKVNANLAVVEDGLIKSCFKGTPDELNNACYNTYSLHKQKYPNQILDVIDRDIYLKITRTIRVILSFFSKSKYRTLVKDALKSNDNEIRYRALKALDLRNLKNFGKNVSKTEIAKTLAFQLGQTLLLLSAIEVYTKEDIGSYYFDLIPFLEREVDANLNILQIYLDFFIASIKYKVNALPKEVLRK